MTVVGARLRVATCATMPEPDPDETLLIETLRAGGIDARICAWDSPAVDWDAPEPTVIRSTWNYYRALDDFLAWAARAERAAPLWNGRSVIHWNAHKRYLADLDRWGTAVVPTVFAAAHTSFDVAKAVADRGWNRFVVKPAVSAGSFETACYHATDAGVEAAARHVATLTRTTDVMLQPYVASVEAYGERSIVWIDGEITHAVRKSPRFSDGDESVEGPLPVADDERALTESVLERFAFQLLYARVDIIRDEAGRPMVMELELIEPSLFLTQEPRALVRLVTALQRRLRDREREREREGER